MATLLVNNSYSQVTGLTIDQERGLKNVLSYTPDPSSVYFSGGYRPKIPLIDKKGFFPTGLIYKALDYFESNKIKIHVHDLRVKPSTPPVNQNPKNKLPKLYQDQQWAVAMAEAKTTGTIVMPTGTGKSITMCALVHRLGLKTLIIVPNLGLKEQLTKTFEHYFGKTSNIVIRNIDSPDLNTLTDFDCLIIDEAHHSAAKTYRNLNKKAWTKIYRRFFFTATPARNREEEQILLESITGEVIYELTYETAVKKGYIVPMQAFYIELPKRNVNGYSWQEVYKELVTDNKPRNQLIGAILMGLNSQKFSTLCLVKEIKHGEALKELTTFEFANGEDNNSIDLVAKFNSKALTCLIGTNGVLGEGVDTKPAEFIVIAGLGKSRPLLQQAFGRGFRNYEGKAGCTIILFKDKSHKFTVNHFNAQVKLLKSQYKVTPVELDIEGLTYFFK